MQAIEQLKLDLDVVAKQLAKECFEDANFNLFFAIGYVRAEKILLEINTEFGFPIFTKDNFCNYLGELIEVECLRLQKEYEKETLAIARRKT
jgi:hypothetical protein